MLFFLARTRQQVEGTLERVGVAYVWNLNPNQETGVVGGSHVVSEDVFPWLLKPACRCDQPTHKAKIKSVISRCEYLQNNNTLYMDVLFTSLLLA